MKPQQSATKSKSLIKPVFSSNKISSLAIEIDKKQQKNLTNPSNKKASKMFSSSNTLFQKDKKTELQMNYLVLHRDFKQSKPKYAYYLILDLFRHILVATALVFLFKYPYMQIITISCLNLFMVFYLILVRPFSRLKDVIQNTINELMVSICCCSCTYLAYLDRIGDENIVKRMRAGWVIHYVNMILMIFFTAIFFIELIFAIKDILPKAIKLIGDKIRRAKLNKKKNSIYPKTGYTLNTLDNEEMKFENKSRNNKFD